MADRVVLLRPLAFQQRLGLAIAILLLPERADRVAAMMPDDRGRTESQRPALIVQPPADVHIVARDAILGIKPADRLQARFPKRHVAARNMLGLLIGEQDLGGAAWRVCDTIGNRAIA